MRDRGRKHLDGDRIRKRQSRRRRDLGVERDRGRPDDAEAVEELACRKLVQDVLAAGVAAGGHA